MKNFIGSFLKLKRIEKGITQEELCEGICTPSYLSRIENNHVVADENIYKLLFHKLGIDYENINETYSEVNERIENLYRDMIHKKNLKENIYELKRLSSALCDECSLKYEIVYSRYLLMNGEVDKAGKILNNLSYILKPEYHRNFFLYSNVLMIYYYLKEDYTKALEVGLILKNIKDYESLADDYELGLFYYNLALIYSKLHFFDRCIRYSELALNTFNSNYFFERSIDCQILLGISYNNLGFYDKSLKSYTLAKRLLKFLPEKNKTLYEGKIYNNIGYCYERQGNYSQAIDSYVKSLDNKSNTNERLRTLINLVRCNMLHGNKFAAQQWLQLGLDLRTETTHKKFVLQLDIYSILLLKDNVSIEDIEKLENNSIKYFSQNNMWDLVYEYSKIFASIYEKHSHYKKANQMYKIALNAIEKCKGR